MQLKLFIIPVKNVGAPEAEMNDFLRGHRVLAVKKEFVADGENSFWTFSKAALKEIEGVGEARLEKYGEALVQLVTREAKP